MENIIKYNKLIEEIVDKFAKRYFKEIFNENEADYRLMDYHGIPNMLELSDMYLDINDILIAELYQIPCNILTYYYHESLEAHMEHKEFKYNLYNYWRIKKDLELYKKEEEESLKKSEEAVKLAKIELEKTILSHKKEN